MAFRSKSPSRDLVPGDLILLEAGDQVPADAQVVSAVALRVDESVLTGESVSVAKSSGVEGDRNQVMMGTYVVAGRAEGVISATGAATAFGKIATLTVSVEDKGTNLSRQLGRLGRQLGAVALGLGAAIAATGILLGARCCGNGNDGECPWLLPSFPKVCPPS